jgi:hypothetical protein
MDERRKEERRKLVAFSPVYDAGQGTILGYLADLTMKGAMVIGEHALEDGARLDLAIEFPSRLRDVFGRRMTVAARVARCVPDKGPGSYRIGFEFDQLDSEHAHMIRVLLDTYQLSPPIKKPGD